MRSAVSRAPRPCRRPAPPRPATPVPALALALLGGLASALGVGVASTPAGAVEITMETRPAGSETAREVSSMTIDGRRLRMQTPEQDGYMIFLGKEQAMYVVDPGSRTYVLFDEALAKNVGDTLAEARRQMEAQLENVPPEQRAMVERMMAGRMPAPTQPAAKPLLEVKETSETRSVDGISCEVAQLLRDGVVEGSVCVASWGDVGVSRGDLAVFRDMGRFYREILNALGTSAPDLGSQPFEAFDRLEGFPVLATEIENGRPVRETRLRAVEGDEPDDALFSPPPDYERRDPMGGMR